jgi:hypothetical protein
MSKAQKFLDWWILNNVVSTPAEGGDAEAWAHRLAEMVGKAALSSSSMSMILPWIVSISTNG